MKPQSSTKSERKAKGDLASLPSCNKVQEEIQNGSCLSSQGPESECIFPCWNEVTGFILYSAILGNLRADTEGEKKHTTESFGVFLTHWVESSHPHTILSRKCHFLFQETKVWRILSIGHVFSIKGDKKSSAAWKNREVILQRTEVSLQVPTPPDTGQKYSPMILFLKHFQDQNKIIHFLKYMREYYLRRSSSQGNERLLMNSMIIGH